ncbi:MAG: diguanylate cyclase [Betaproteobacteria bacterium]|nr:MAG: diguanylate cyclase [Betaproteobacteria bacterium]
MPNPSIGPQSVIESRHSLHLLQRRIRLFEFIGIGLTAVLVGLATLIPMYGQLRRNLDLTVAYQVQTQAQAASQLFVSFGSITSQLTSRSQIRDALAQYNEGRLSRSELEAFSIPRLQDALEQSPLVVGLLRLDRDGRPAVAIGKTIPEDLWRIPATGARAPEQYGPFRVLGYDVLVVAAAIVTREGLRVGTDIVAFELSSLRNVLANLSSTPHARGARVYLFNRIDGRLVELAPNGAGLVTTAADDPVHAVLRGHDGGGIDAAALPGDEQRMLFAAAMPDIESWQLAVTLDRATLYSSAGRELYWPIVAIVLLMFASGALTLIAIRPLSQRIAEQSQRLALAASIFSTSGDGILLLDAQRQVIELNPAGCRMLQRTPDDVQGRRFCSFAVADPAGPDCAAVWREVDGTGQWQGEMPLRAADGSIFAAWLSLASVRDEAGSITHYGGIFVDISARKEAESQIRTLAYHDELTGLPNRVLMHDRLAHALRHARRARNRIALLFLDLDRFKPVNDSFGHAVGDQLLVSVAERLRQTVREGDTVARVHGDEFVVILEGIENPEPAARVAGKIVGALSSPFTIGDRDIRIGTSIGIAIYPDHGDDADTLIRCADIAMYDAKQAGRNGYRFFADGEEPGGAATA